MGKPSWLNHVTSSTVKKARVYTTKKNRKQIQYNTRVIDNAWEQVCKFNLGDMSPFSLDSPLNSPDVGPLKWQDSPATMEGLAASPLWQMDRSQGVMSHRNNSNNRAVSTSPCIDKENNSLKASRPFRSKRAPTNKKSQGVLGVVQKGHMSDLDSDSDFVPCQPKKRKVPAQQKKASKKVKGQQTKNSKLKGNEAPSKKAAAPTAQYSPHIQSHTLKDGRNVASLTGVDCLASQGTMNLVNNEDVTYRHLVGDTSSNTDMSASSNNRAVSTSPCSDKENNSLKASRPFRSKRAPTNKKSQGVLGVVQKGHKSDLDSDSDFVPCQPKKRKAPAQQKKASKKVKGQQTKNSKGKDVPSKKAPAPTAQYSPHIEAQTVQGKSDAINHMLPGEDCLTTNLVNGDNVTSPVHKSLTGDSSSYNDMSASSSLLSCHESEIESRPASKRVGNCSSMYMTSHDHNSSFFEELVRNRLDQFVTRDRKANTPLSFTSSLNKTGNSKYHTPPSRIMPDTSGPQTLHISGDDSPLAENSSTEETETSANKEHLYSSVIKHVKLPYVMLSDISDKESEHSSTETRGQPARKASKNKMTLRANKNGLSRQNRRFIQSHSQGAFFRSSETSADVLVVESPSSSEVSGSPKEACLLEQTSQEFVVPESPIEQDSRDTNNEGVTEPSPEDSAFRTSTPFMGRSVSKPAGRKGRKTRRCNTRSISQGEEALSSKRKTRSQGCLNTGNTNPSRKCPKLRKSKRKPQANASTRTTSGHSPALVKKRKARKHKSMNTSNVCEQNTVLTRLRRSKQQQNTSSTSQESMIVREIRKPRKEQDVDSTRKDCRGKKSSKTGMARTAQHPTPKSVTPCSVPLPKLSEEEIQRLSGNNPSRHKQQRRPKQNCFKTRGSPALTPALRAIIPPGSRGHPTPADFLGFSPGCLDKMVTPNTSHRAKSPGSGVRQTPLRGPMSIPRRQNDMMSPLFQKALKNRCRMSPKEKILLHCQHERVLTFQECIPGDMMARCVKIGEGVYGEVFRTTRQDGSSVALKIIPVEGSFSVNDEPQKTFDEILPEIVISRELSELADGKRNQTSGFIHLHRVCLVQGAWPAHLLAMWDQWHQERDGESENDRPDIFPDSQLFVVLEFADGGCDLEHFQFHGFNQARAVLYQICVALAVAESALQFEHRDLHWGNILVRKVAERSCTHRVTGQDVCVQTGGLEVNIIDFTLSRMQKNGQPLYCDLSADPTLFEGTGDYQFDIYRAMRNENRNDWSSHCPYTNVLWLHYLADKLLSKTYRIPKKSQRQWRQKFQTFLKQVLECRTVAQVLQDCHLFKDN